MAEMLPPCRAGCPVHTDAGAYSRLVAEGRYEEAREVICRTNPFPSVCAYICQRPCEKNCRRGQLDSPVGIRALKRFVIRRVGAEAPQPTPLEASASRVAVVGAGPAGLTAAFDLRQRGHRVSIFERLDRPGGMLNVIPRYRLPQDAVDMDVENILSTGIDITCNCQIGRDFTVGDLLDKDFDAIVAASGLSRSRGIAIPGFGSQRFTSAIPWMTDVWLGDKVDLGRRVVVVGGGNVAADVARTARRLGAEVVTLICLESREEIPAEAHEIALAEAEGIEILPRQALKRVLNHKGEIIAVELMSVLSVFDDDGRFRPTYDPSHIRTMTADMVILSIGQAPDRSWAEGAPVQTDERGRILVDRETHQTDFPKVFLAGESLRGPGAAIQAVADGHEVAEVVAQFLATGYAAKPQPDEARALAQYPPDVAAKLRQMVGADTEAKPFADSEPLLAEADARREGGRCLGCLAGAVIDETKCSYCLTCFRVCPLQAIEAGDPMYANPVRCQACGVCAAMCPGNAIDLEYWRAPDLGQPAEAGETEKTGSSVALICGHRENGQIEAADTLRVPCLARLKPVDLLRPFQRGYQTVQLYGCEEEECKYGKAWRNIDSVVNFARSMLERVLPEAKIELHLSEKAGASSGEPAGEAK